MDPLLEDIVKLARQVNITEVKLYPCERFHFDGHYESLNLTTWDESPHNGDVITGSHVTVQDYDIPSAKRKALYKKLREDFIRQCREKQETKWLRKIGVEE